MFYLQTMSCDNEMINDRDPFFYSQDLDGYLRYQEKYLNPVQDVSSQKPKQDTQHNQKKKVTKRNQTDVLNPGSTTLTSHVIKKVKKGRSVIKISITNLEEDASSSEQSDETIVQYVINEHYDEILDEAEHLVRKICKKLVADTTS